MGPGRAGPWRWHRNENDEKVLVLFSGGKDSFLTACRLVEAGKHVILFSCNNGALAKKRLQSQQAFYSGLTYLSPTRPAYRICLPGTRTPVPRNVIHERRFLNSPCATCAAGVNCDGCFLCGNCCC